ncbi:DUF6188 family protein [Pseudonocardia spinosispora]|uniref:DUF6188 family protein n=1 Tax=Pseudonocardia spinosispora TaxID=103441 RepID=UPI0012EB77C9|nr:DUF6188 family protein [Pseudonocardia spinosispora]
MEIELRGESISKVQADYTLYLYVTGGFGISIESEFVLVGSEEKFSLAPGNFEAGGHISSLVGVPIAACSVDEVRGGLCVEFVNGSTIVVAADDEYESWNLTGPQGLRIVCMPGGELAFWSSTA